MAAASRFLICLVLLASAACARKDVAQQAPAGPAPTQYEYKVVTYRDDRRVIRERQALLNDMSAQGWELVQCEGDRPVTSCTFRKPKK